MSWDVILFPKAHEEYQQIIIYLRGFYPSTPLKFDKEYQHTVSMLAWNPYGFSAYPDNPTYRRAIIGKYSLFFTVHKDRHEVHIHRIIRSSWDIPKALHPSEDDEAIL